MNPLNFLFNPKHFEREKITHFLMCTNSFLRYWYHVFQCLNYNNWAMEIVTNYLACHIFHRTFIQFVEMEKIPQKGFLADNTQQSTKKMKRFVLASIEHWTSI